MEGYGMMYLIFGIMALAVFSEVYGRMKYDEGFKDGAGSGYREGVRDSKQELSKSLAFMRIEHGGMDPFEACKLYEPEKKRA